MDCLYRGHIASQTAGRQVRASVHTPEARAGAAQEAAAQGALPPPAGLFWPAAHTPWKGRSAMRRKLAACLDRPQTPRTLRSSPGMYFKYIDNKFRQLGHGSPGCQTQSSSPINASCAPKQKHMTQSKLCHDSTISLGSLVTRRLSAHGTFAVYPTGSYMHTKCSD